MYFPKLYILQAINNNRIKEALEIMSACCVSRYLCNRKTLIVMPQIYTSNRIKLRGLKKRMDNALRMMVKPEKFLR